MIESISSDSASASSATKSCDYCQETIPAKATRCRNCKSWLSSKSVHSGDGWRIEKESFVDAKSEFLDKRERVWLVISNEFLKSRFRYWMNDHATFLQKEARVNIRDIFTVIDKLRELASNYDRWNSNAERVKILKSLLEYVEKEFESEIAMFDSCRREGVITFDLLQHVYSRGTKVLVDVDGGAVATEVISNRYGHTESGKYFEIICEVVKSTGSAFFIQKHKAYIEQFDGARKLQSLKVRPASEAENSAEIEKLISRGMLFFKIALGCHHMEYEGVVSFHSEDAYLHYQADGRVMIDGVNFNRMNPGYPSYIDDSSADDGSVPIEVPVEVSNPSALSKELLMKAWPTVGGFSFYCKRWAELRIESLRNIHYVDHAMDHLVMRSELKQLIRAVVTQRTNTLTDIITGKGAGCVFLLHGPPGVGKTLTAESVAEYLHRPLYSITVGELGTSVQDLEEKLQSILDIASSWDAVLLLDEADVFLEQRSSSVDIERNGLVCVFLRLLEYYQGVLFLTTNHVRYFDEALFSRVSVALEYKDLNRSYRYQIWSNLLRMIGIEAADSKDKQKTVNDNAVNLFELSLYPINGRQIRTSLQISQALARSEKREQPQQRDITKALALVTKCSSSADRYVWLKIAASGTALTLLTLWRLRQLQY